MNSLLSTYTIFTVIKSAHIATLPVYLSFIVLPFLFGCATASKHTESTGKMLPPKEITVVPHDPDSLTLSFAGDIMAHTVNFNMKNYDKIYDDVRSLLLGDDLTFGNLESPVAGDLPLSTYPRFNVHIPYLQAAISGGFDVFSLANNHSNDQGIAGIGGTWSSLAALPSDVYYSGLKKNSTDGFQPVLIRKNGWKIL